MNQPSDTNPTDHEQRGAKRIGRILGAALLSNPPRRIDQRRAESEPCEKGTDGCAIEHSAEADTDGTCEGW